MNKLLFFFSMVLASMALSHPMNVGHGRLPTAIGSPKLQEVQRNDKQFSHIKFFVGTVVWSNVNKKEVLLNKAIDKTRNSFKKRFADFKLEISPKSCYSYNAVQLRKNEYKINATCRLSYSFEKIIW